MVRSGLLGLGLAALWACAPREPTVYHVERGRTYVEDRAVVWERIEGFLRANDIAVLSADQATGVIMAERREYQDAGWAEPAHVAGPLCRFCRGVLGRPL